MEEATNNEGLPRQSIVRRPDFKPDKGGAQVKKGSGSDYQPTSEEEEGEEAEEEEEEEEESSSDSDSSERNGPGNIEKKKKGRARFGSDSNSSDDDSDKTKPAKTFPVKMDVKRFYGLSSAPKHKLTPSNNCFYKIGNNTNNDSYAKGGGGEGGGLKRGADHDFVNYSTYQRQAARNIKYAYDSNSEEESENEEEEEEGGDYKKKKGKKNKFYAVRDSDSDFEVSYTVLH